MPRSLDFLWYVGFRAYLGIVVEVEWPHVPPRGCGGGVGLRYEGWRRAPLGWWPRAGLECSL